MELFCGREIKTEYTMCKLYMFPDSRQYIFVQLFTPHCIHFLNIKSKSDIVKKECKSRE